MEILATMTSSSTEDGVPCTSETNGGSAGASAFFAKKKKPGKKGFKIFNANKIDASVVASAVHVDAPQLSFSGGRNSNDATVDRTDTNSVHPSTSSGSGLPTKTGTAEWDDIPTHRDRDPPMAATSGKAAAELLDMVALHEKRRGEDDIAEKIRIEETRNQLQSAKDGMARAAKRLEEEKLKKQAEKDNAAAAVAVRPRFGVAASSSGVGTAGSSGKWVPAHRRNTGVGVSSGGTLSGLASSMSKVGMADASLSGRNFRRSVDTQDESAFPDLASAEEIMALKQRMDSKPTYVLNKKKLTTPAWSCKSSTDASPEVIAVPRQSTFGHSQFFQSTGNSRVEIVGSQGTTSPALSSMDAVTDSKISAKPSGDIASDVISKEGASRLAMFSPKILTTVTEPSLPAVVDVLTSPSIATETGARKKKKKKDLSTFKTTT